MRYNYLYINVVLKISYLATTTRTHYSHSVAYKTVAFYFNRCIIYIYFYKRLAETVKRPRQTSIGAL